MSSPFAPCPQCGGEEFHGRVCVSPVLVGSEWVPCGWRENCLWCGGRVEGRVDKAYCRPACRRRAHAAKAPECPSTSAAVAFLAGLPADEFRRVVAAAAVAHARANSLPTKGRLRIRFTQNSSV